MLGLHVLSSLIMVCLVSKTPWAAYGDEWDKCERGHLDEAPKFEYFKFFNKFQILFSVTILC